MPNAVFSKAAYTLGVNPQTERTGLAVTPSDSADLANGPCRGVYVTGAGNVSVNLAGGGNAVLTGLSAGQIVDINATRILATSTTATGVYALYPAGSL